MPKGDRGGQERRDGQKGQSLRTGEVPAQVRPWRHGEMHTGGCHPQGAERPAVCPASSRAVRWPNGTRLRLVPKSSAAPGSQAPALRLVPQLQRSPVPNSSAAPVPKLQLGTMVGRLLDQCANRSDFGTGVRPLNRLGLVRVHHPTTPGSQAPALRWFPSSSAAPGSQAPAWEPRWGVLDRLCKTGRTSELGDSAVEPPWVGRLHHLPAPGSQAPALRLVP